MNSSVFNQIIRGNTLMLNIILDNKYLSEKINSYIIKNDQKGLYPAINNRFIHLLKKYRRIVISTSDEHQAVSFLSGVKLVDKYISLDLEGFNSDQLNIVLQDRTLIKVNQIRLCYLFDDLISLPLDNIIKQFGEFGGDKILLVYLSRTDSINKLFWDRLFSKLKQYGIILNILPLPNKALNQSISDGDQKSCLSIINNLKILEDKYKLQVFYDFPCGSPLDDRFEGFCPGYFSLVVFSDGNVSFCRLSRISFGNINLDSLNDINKNRVKFLSSLSVLNCSQCEYYPVCGGGCLIDLDEKNQKNLVCFM